MFWFFHFVLDSVSAGDLSDVRGFCEESRTGSAQLTCSCDQRSVKTKQAFMQMWSSQVPLR